MSFSIGVLLVEVNRFQICLSVQLDDIHIWFVVNSLLLELRFNESFHRWTHALSDIWWVCGHQSYLCFEKPTVVKVCPGTLSCLKCIKCVSQDHHLFGLEQRVVNFSMGESILDIVYVRVRLAELVLLSAPGHEQLIELERLSETCDLHLLIFDINHLHLAFHHIDICSIKEIIFDEVALILTQRAHLPFHYICVFK